MAYIATNGIYKPVASAVWLLKRGLNCSRAKWLHEQDEEIDNPVYLCVYVCVRVQGLTNRTSVDGGGRLVHTVAQK